MAKKVLVIGSLNIDMRVEVDHMPAIGETILSGDMKYVPGGKGANQACAVGKLGNDVSILGAVGDDGYAEMQRKSLSEAGVDISDLIVRKDVSTGIALIPVNKVGDNYIIVIQGANATLSKEDIDRKSDLIEESDLVMLQLEIPMDTVLYAAKKAKGLGKTVILDPAPAEKNIPEELYHYVDVIKPNETELGMLTGEEDAGDHLTEATGILRGLGVKNVLVTLGEKGVFLDSEESGQCMIPAHKTKVADTTAAGDSFTAGFAVKLLEGKTPKEAAEFANYVSAIVVSRPGAQTSIPTLKEVEEYIAKDAFKES